MELADAVHNCATNADVILLKNHGVVITAGTPSEALTKAIFLELSCEYVVKDLKPTISYMDNVEVSLVRSMKSSGV